ncbi:MAG: leucine-rich repeat domain-containing protein [Lachnospiraceae bacterium]|nr:leucine-rich repeat domain-containing protein [Lachnospiraceae bacterium]
MEYTESHLEQSVNSTDIYDQWMALKAGLKLERFVHDVSYTNRAEAAKQGYGLDLLSNDPHTYVQGAVREYLAQHELTLEEWTKENPDKCVYPRMKKELRDTGLQVSEITLLTADEVEKYATVIPKWGESFWIQPGSRAVYGDYHAFTAGPRLDRSPSSVSAEHNLSEIRPALRMKNLMGVHLNKEDKIDLLGNMWTVLDASQNEVLLLADKSFGRSTFGKTGPYYETSKVKKHLDGWLEWKLGNNERIFTQEDAHRLLAEGDGKNVVIPKEYTIIGAFAFENCVTLESIEIPASVEAIDDFAFYGCDSLKSVIFDDDSLLRAIGPFAFDSCFDLEHIELPMNVDVDHYAFNNCPAEITRAIEKKPSLDARMADAKSRSEAISNSDRTSNREDIEK